MKSFGWTFVVLALGMLAMMLGVCVWLIVAGHAPPSLLVAPFTTALAAGAAYLKGKFEAPPWLTDPRINAMVRSQHPPPDLAAFAPFRVPTAGRVPPPVVADVDVELESERRP